MHNSHDIGKGGGGSGSDRGGGSGGGSRSGSGARSGSGSGGRRGSDRRSGGRSGGSSGSSGATVNQLFHDGDPDGGVLRANAQLVCDLLCATSCDSCARLLCATFVRDSSA